MIGEVTPAMQQNDHRPFPPAFAATVEPAINDVVFREVARSGCGKAEVQSRFIGVELNPRQLAFSGNEIRPFQELERFLQPQISPNDGRPAYGQNLNGVPVKKFGQGREHTLVIRGDFAAGGRRARLMVEVLSYKNDQAGNERDGSGHSGQLDHLPHFRTPLIIHSLGDLQEVQP